jgi:hypothetical protein
MSIIALLHNLLKEKLPSIHATRLRALMAAVEAGLKGASVSITQLGRALSGPACIKHKIKRMDRLPQQKTEAWISASALNRMTNLGMPVSVKI